MEFVTLNGTYRGYLQTTDQATFPETAAWPDSNIEAADVVAKILGVVYGGTKTVTQQTDIGLHLITIDCTGVEAGTVIELSGEYYIDLIRYVWSEQLFVGINSSTIDDASEIITAFKADADFGTAGLLLDAKRARQFDKNRRTIDVLGDTQWRYTVYEDDATTVAYQVDFNPATGAKAVV
jgi:hypothetical protein